MAARPDRKPDQSSQYDREAHRLFHAPKLKLREGAGHQHEQERLDAQTHLEVWSGRKPRTRERNFTELIERTIDQEDPACDQHGNLCYSRPQGPDGKIGCRRNPYGQCAENRQ